MKVGSVIFFIEDHIALSQNGGGSAKLIVNLADSKIELQSRCLRVPRSCFTWERKNYPLMEFCARLAPISCPR
jgi:hypothetical protein